MIACQFFCNADKTAHTFRWTIFLFSGQCETNILEWNYYLVSQGGEVFYESYRNKKRKYMAIRPSSSLDFQ